MKEGILKALGTRAAREQTCTGELFPLTIDAAVATTAPLAADLAVALSLHLPSPSSSEVSLWFAPTANYQEQEPLSTGKAAKAREETEISMSGHRF